MDPSLANFYAVMNSFLRGKVNVSDIESQLGNSPSGTNRLALYRTLVHAQWVEVITKIHKPVRVRADQVEEQGYSKLLGRYLSSHVPTHWQLSHYASTFARWLESEGESGKLSCSVLPELADWCITRNTLSRVSTTGAYQVRAYSANVPAYCHAVESQSITPVLEMRPTVVLAYRCMDNGKIRYIQPSSAMIELLLEKDDPQYLSQSTSTKEDKFTAMQQLITLGIIENNQ